MIPVHGLSTNAKVVKKVNFSVYGSDTIRKNAVTRVDEIALYTRGIPTHNGVNSLAMGSSDRRIRCTTCNELMQKCPGHNGEIRLPLPVYQALYIDHTLKVLRSVCFFCSEICLSDEDKASLIEKYSDDKTRFNHTYSIARTRKKCPHCKGIRPSYVRCPLGIKTEWVDKSFDTEEEQEYAMQKFTPALAYSILNNINDIDANNFFGKGLHPRDLIATSVLVPPPIIRPAISTAEGSRTKGQDDITLRLQEINRRSNELRLCMNKQEETGLPIMLCDVNKVLPRKTDTVSFNVNDSLLNVDALTPDLIDRWNRLQADVFGLVNPAAIRGGLPASIANNNRNSANGKYIIDRIKGKNGRFRNCLMGKRVNFSGRSVITPDSTIDVDQLGVPYELAMVLTVPEKVTPSNIADLRSRILNGPGELVGAQSVINTEGDLISLKSCKNRKDIVLRIGWIVERHLKNGDWVIFNRQPTLHRMGFNGHRVVLTKGKTFRLNLSVCAVYNADFDGDEMNIHVCQSACATSEVSTLMAINRNIISAQNNKPCFGIVQDSLVGAWLMTDPGVFLTRADMLRFSIYVKFANNGTATLPPPAISKPNEMWTGAQLISLVFPHTLMYQKGSMSGIASYETKDLLIKNGQILFGRLSKSTLGATAGAISDIIHHEHGGPKKAVEFLSDVQRVVNQWLLYKSSFSIGASDCVTNEKSHNEVVDCIKSAVNNSKMILTSKVPKSLKEMAEGATTRILSDVIMKTATIIKNNASTDNSIITCVTAGSKGSPLNIAQVCGQVGQQIVGGERILNGTSGRTLPCFKHGEHATVNANGYIQNSFMLGLQPTEFFFSAMSGREGLVDTAVKTANSGYIQRCLVKASEDNQCHYDGTVRNAQGMIVQFKYSDNFDPRKVERIKVAPLLMTPDEIKRNVGNTECEMIMNFREKSQKLLYQPNKPLHDLVLLPINITRMFESTTWNREMPHGLDENTLLAKVSTTVSEITKKHSACKYIVPLYIHWSMRLSNIPKNLDVDAFLREVKHRCLSSVVAGGDAVGNTAALSIGEPSTQMTLNSFHTAGTSHAGVTMGIPRLKEVMGYSKQLRTPQTTLEFPNKTPEELTAIAAKLTRLTLSQVTENMNVVLEPPGVIDESYTEDVKFALKMDTYFAPDLSDPSMHVGVLELNKHLLNDYNLTPAKIAPIIKSLAHNIIETDVHVSYSEVNTIEWWVRIRILDVSKHFPDVISNREMCERGTVLRFVKLLCHEIKLGGFNGIEAAAVDKIERWNGESNEMVNVIQTRSTILHRAYAIPGVDWSRVMTNDIHNVVNTLGIDAALTVIFNELNSTLTADGSYIDPRHIELTANTMTLRGYVMPLNRHGLNNIKTGPLTRSSFEETSEVLKDAAIFAESEDVSGSISASIMMGQLSAIGTGRFEVRIPKPESVSVKENSRIIKTKGTATLNRNKEDTWFIPRESASFKERIPYMPYSPKR